MHRHDQIGRHVFKTMTSPGADAGRDRRGARRHSVGERPPPRAGAPRTRGRAHPVLVEAERSCGSISPASGSICGEARRCRHGVSAGGLGGLPHHPVRRNAILRADRAADRQATAVRAVGAANGRNPVSIIAPCHRVIGSTGKFTGFAGGLDVKAQLLALEGARGLAELLMPIAP